MKKILFVASESVPFIKTGGLADVVGSLPEAFDKKEFDVRVILPNYTIIDQKWKSKMKFLTHFYMDLNWRKQYVGILELKYNGITYYFLDNEYYFSGKTPYGNVYDDIERFAFFSKAALSCLPIIDYRPDLIHCHDWQTGLVPVYLDNFRYGNDYFKGIKTVMTIHNLKFQGVWDTKRIKDVTGLPAYYFTPDKLEAYKDANCLKGGIVYSDWITTVSKSYADEIKMPFYGEGLDGLMRARANNLSGIVNGIDYKTYDPATDDYIENNYDVTDFRKYKVKNKVALQKELGLLADPKIMTIGMVSRLTDQKGFDLIEYVMDEICNDNVQIILLGTGEEKYENMFRHFAWKYGDKVSANIFYSEELSHKIYASVDAFLMPSLFEPCGLSQLMSLRYGTVPIVRQTGGLIDTVKPFNEFEKTGTGFGFMNYNAHEMLGVIRYAEHIYYDKKRWWNQIIDRGMVEDFSWEKSAKEYADLYNKEIGEIDE